jgi:hypothetical protein
VDSVIIIFKILNQDIVAMCIMGCGKKKFRNTPLVNNPVYRSIKKKFKLVVCYSLIPISSEMGFKIFIIGWHIG